MTTPDPAEHPQDATTQPIQPVPAPPAPAPVQPAVQQDVPHAAAPQQPAVPQAAAPEQPTVPQAVFAAPSQPYPQAAAPQPAPVAPAPYDPWAPTPTPAAAEHAPRKRRTWIPVTAAAASAALVTALAAVGISQALGDDTDGTAPASSSIADLGKDTSDTVPVSGSSSEDPNWEAVAKAVQDSVVAIEVTTDSGGAQGSGVIVDDTGHIVTNNHVVSGSNSVTVTLTDGRMFDATVVGTDPTTDLAVIRLDDPPSDLQPAALGDSSQVDVGEAVMAVGNPLGLANTVTTGIVSAVDRPVTTQGEDSSEATVTNAIQIDAAVNPGNSGGPLFDAAGRVIGINSSIATLSSESGSIGLGFAIPVNLVKNIAQQLIDDGTAEHAFLGVGLDDATATADGVTRRGAEVKQITDGSPAADAGIEVGDVIVAIDGNPVGGAESLTAYVRSYTSGDQVKLTIVRDGTSIEQDVTLATREDVAGQSSQGDDNQNGDQGQDGQGFPGQDGQGEQGQEQPGDGSLGGLSPEDLWRWYQEQQQGGQG